MRNHDNSRNYSQNAEWLKRAVVVWVVLLTVTSSVAAQQANYPLVRPKTIKTTTSPAATPRPMTSSAPAPDRYRIGPGDVLEVRLYKLPDLSRESIRVEEAGTIRMPLINEEIQAACRTENELAKDIASRYLPLMRNPQVDVFIKEYNSRPVAVIGAVNAPGRFQLQRRIRLLDLLSYAGGPAERAGGNIQVVHGAPYPSCEAGARTSNNNELGIGVFKLRDTLAGNSRSNPYVRPGDVITVLEFEQIYVIGNVIRPSAFPLKERITLSQAIAMAGGTLPDSQSDRIRIVRQNTSNNMKQELIADLKAINKRQAPDVVLQPNDIVEVPTASGRRFLRNILEGVVPGIARFPVRVIR
ncbi:MAG TPA: polysaccharide biosynthesis/export family protein [Pyrinomonadaceae bacterium]|nr:polysaccharide biosynthesis/export family protein [Pyrinomonadaceae bacterium]